MAFHFVFPFLVTLFFSCFFLCLSVSSIFIVLLPSIIDSGNDTLLVPHY